MSDPIRWLMVFVLAALALWLLLRTRWQDWCEAARAAVPENTALTWDFLRQGYGLLRRYWWLWALLVGWSFLVYVIALPGSIWWYNKHYPQMLSSTTAAGILLILGKPWWQWLVWDQSAISVESILNGFPWWLLLDDAPEKSLSFLQPLGAAPSTLLILLGAWWTWRWLRRQERNGTDLAAARFILLALVGAALLILPVRLLSFFGKGDFSGWAYQYLTTPAGHLWRTAFSTLVAAVVLVVFRRLWKQETLRPADIVAESTAVYIPLFVFWSIWTLLYFVGREVLHHLQGSFHLASNIDHLARFVLLWVPYLLVVRGCSLFEAIRDNFRFWIRSSGLPLVFAVTIFVAGLAPAGLYLLLRYMGASAFLPSEILGAAWASLNFVVEAAAVGLVCSLATEAEEAADEDIEEVESGLDF